MSQKVQSKEKNGAITPVAATRGWLRSASLSIMQTLRRWRGWILPSVAALCTLALVLAVLVAVREGWHTATAKSVECQVAFQPLPYATNGYIELFLEKQELAEPLFDGGYFINLAQEYGRNPMRLKVTISGARSYGSSTALANLRWDDFAESLWMGGKEKMAFVAQSGSHRNFPFDSANFDFTLKTDPLVNIPVFRFNNRVPGFYMPCDAARVQRLGDGSFRILFELRRDLLTRVAAIMLFGAAVIFAFAITIFAETKTLPTALASYFFSLWSIRGIFGLAPEGFPTLLDVGILTLCMLILVLLAVRILIRLSGAVQQRPTTPGPLA
jgi:hypothetical protein